MSEKVDRYVIVVNAPVIYKPCPHGAGDSVVIGGLKCNIFTSVSAQCRGTGGLLIPWSNQAK